MKPSITIQIPADSETLVRRLLALHEELEPRALSAAAGTVFDACEAALVDPGRDWTAPLLATAVACRVEAAEKTGRRCVRAPAAGPRKTAGRRPGNWSVRSAASPGSGGTGRAAAAPPGRRRSTTCLAWRAASVRPSRSMAAAWRRTGPSRRR